MGSDDDALNKICRLSFGHMMRTSRPAISILFSSWTHFFILYVFYVLFASSYAINKFHCILLLELVFACVYVCERAVCPMLCAELKKKMVILIRLYIFLLFILCETNELTDPVSKPNSYLVMS